MPSKKKVIEAPAVKVEKKYATLTSWSYSVYSSYVKCALSVCFDKVLCIRIEEPPNPHFEKGDRVHKSAESHIKGTGKAPTVIPELVGVKDRLNVFRKMRAMAELEMDEKNRLSHRARAVQNAIPVLREIFGL